jgi:photosynthetic reaction center cytochrome c subunit
MKRRVLLVLVAVLLVAGERLDAQGGQRKFANLQVFPPDTSQDVLIAAMKNFTRALGVRCPFCHVGEDGMPLEKFDFASDSKPQKQTAREMMRLTAEINGRITKLMPDAPDKGYQVTCWTCHRGTNHPQHMPEAVKPPGH